LHTIILYTELFKTSLLLLPSPIKYYRTKPFYIPICVSTASLTTGIPFGTFPLTFDTTEYPTAASNARNIKLLPPSTKNRGNANGKELITCPNNDGKNNAISKITACWRLNRTGRDISGFRARIVNPKKQINWRKGIAANRALKGPRRMESIAPRVGTRANRTRPYLSPSTRGRR